MSDKVAVLFVCLGNICRSPLAEALFLNHITDLKVNTQFKVDSCGTGNWHAGEFADIRTRKSATDNGIKITHRARQLTLNDFNEFHHIYVMDENNLRDVKRINSSHTNIQIITDSTDYKGKIIPDPYYGNENDFNYVFNLLNEVTLQLASQLIKQYQLK